MSTLAEFLLQMLSEDEAAARDRIDNPPDWPYVQYFPPFDPARVLAEVQTKRGIVAEHSNPSPPCWWTWDGSGGHDDPENGNPDDCPTLRLLAQPYRSAPGWRTEWDA